MDLDDTLLLGVTIAILCVGIVLVVLQSKILKLLLNGAKVKDEVKVIKPEVEVKPQHTLKAPVKTGLTKGEAKLLGIEDDEQVAVIMAAVSNAANIPLTQMKIKSIRKIEG